VEQFCKSGSTHITTPPEMKWQQTSIKGVNLKRCQGGIMNKQISSACIILVFSIMLLAMAVMPEPVLAQTSKGVALCNSWEFQKAEPVLREALKTNPRDIEASYYLGVAVLMQDKHEEALQIFSKVLADVNSPGRQNQASVPNKYQIQIALARTRLELKQNDEALKNLETANKVRPNSVEVYVYRGVYYLNLKNPQKAVVELEKAISLDKKDAYAHYYAGRAYLQSGNPARAVEMFKTFLQLAPLAPEASRAKALVTELC
jgi:cytochrome c-type biogenesis protein CcmH/NrfG